MCNYCDDDDEDEKEKKVRREQAASLSVRASPLESKGGRLGFET